LGGGDRHLARLLRPLIATPSTSRRTALAAGLQSPGHAGRRALIVAIGDFLTDEPVGPWRRASCRNEVVAIRLIDPREESLPDAGLIALKDAELGTRRVVDSGSRRVRDAYARAARERKESFRSWCAEAR